MQKVYQSKFHGELTRGNPLAACLASLFEVSLADVPELEEMGAEEYIEAMLTWVNERGYDMEVYRSNPGGELARGMHYLATGTSPRGPRHSVIYRDGFMVHDPHPEGGGLVKVDSYWVFEQCQELMSQPS